MNSGIRRIGVLTQYKAHSLIRHLQGGWGFLHKELGEFVEILPASQRVHEAWYRGTADALYQNIDILRTYQPTYVLVLAGDHVYKMDYGPMLAFHFEHKADLTIGCIEVPLSEASGFGIMSVDDHFRVVRFQEKPENPEPMPGCADAALVSMGIYVFNTDFLYEQLIKDADTEGSSHDFGKDVIPSVIHRYAVHAYPFRQADGGAEAYWRDVGTVDAYYAANMELLAMTPKLNLYDQQWPIWTYQEQLPPAKFVFNETQRRGTALEIHGVGRLYHLRSPGLPFTVVFQCAYRVVYHGRGMRCSSRCRDRFPLPHPPRHPRQELRHSRRYGHRGGSGRRRQVLSREPPRGGPGHPRHAGPGNPSCPLTRNEHPSSERGFNVEVRGASSATRSAVYGPA